MGTGKSSTSILRAFGEALRAKREALNLSQEELAFRSEVHRTYISELERGIKNPSLTTLAKLADALGTAKSELVLELERAEARSKHAPRTRRA
jgi:transcriptional regulator with XRE-family HTH domain